MPGTANKIEDPCQECRERHLKCDDNRPKCKQCERLGEKCRRGKGKLKFRYGSSARYDATFSKDQTWLEQSKNAKIQFVDQGPELENFYSQDDIELALPETIVGEEAGDGATNTANPAASTSGTIINPDTSPTLQSAPTGEPVFVSPSTFPSETVLVHSPPKRRRTTDSSSQQTPGDSWQRRTYDPIRSSYRVYEKPKAFSPGDSDAFMYMPERSHVPKVVEAEYRRLADSEAAYIPESLLSPSFWKEEFYWPNSYTTTQCACLMRYYIEQLAPWFDVGDPQRHFALAVPQRARRCPPLLNAIFTAAARHLDSLPHYKTSAGIIKYQNVLLPKLTSDTAVKYHNACIAYLIKLSGDPEHVQDENLLAASVILRFYEEIDTSYTGEDQETFLSTFSIFVNAQANPYYHIMGQSENSEYLRPGMFGGGIQENALAYLKSFQHAAFRIALRQETTIAFMRQRPIRLPLGNWTILQGFDEAEDFVWADRQLYHCANVLQFCFGEDTAPGKSQVERWKELKSFEAQWEQTKPLSFSPIHYEEPDRAKGEVLPHIWHMAQVHVSGLLSLDLARILLIVYNPSIPRIGPGVQAAQRRISEEVHDIVVRLCGTAMSNPSAQPGMVQAYMAIAVCGEYFHDTAEQQVLLDLLRILEEQHGWPTQKTAKELRQEWGWKL